MLSTRKRFVPVLLLAVVAALPARTTESGTKARPEYDALATAPRSSRAVEAGDLERAGRTLHVEERLGVPSFLWAGKPGPAVAWDGRGHQEPLAAARRHLSTYASLYGLEPRDAASARLVSVHNTGRVAVIAIVDRGR